MLWLQVRGGSKLLKPEKSVNWKTIWLHSAMCGYKVWIWVMLPTIWRYICSCPRPILVLVQQTNGRRGDGHKLSLSPVDLLGQNLQTHTLIFPRSTPFDSKEARTSETSITLPTSTWWEIRININSESPWKPRISRKKKFYEPRDLRCALFATTRTLESWNRISRGTAIYVPISSMFAEGLRWANYPIQEVLRNV
jgi:hypothetical protein